MSRSTRPRTHADQFKKLEYKRPRDVDPEDDLHVDFDAETDESHSEAEQINSSNGREHYETVGSSKIRQAQDVEAVGPQYTGTKISRKKAFTITNEEHDPFAEFSDDYMSDQEQIAAGRLTHRLANLSGTLSNGHKYSDKSDESEGEDDGTSGSYDDEGTEDTEIEEASEELGEASEDDIDRDQVRKMMVEDRSNVASAIARATQIDAEKGRAVKKQKATFDSLLNIRIKLQNGIISTNSMCIAGEKSREEADDLHNHIEAAEKAAIQLLNTLEDISQTIESSRVGTKEKMFKMSSNTDSTFIWEHFKNTDSQNLLRQRKTLQKWSNKTQGATSLPSSQKLNGSSTQGSIIDVINDQLIGMERLVKRTRLPRSCAPLHISEGVPEANDIYDDADFYGIMLKELLEQRSIDASNVQTDTIAQHWQAVRQAKTRKKVDTKASKGRKIRYTIHEKLQNFMAPENRGSWGERQIDDLFGSLLGKKMALNEVEQDDEDQTNGMANEQEALMLFRS